jgi:hypothetical protein
MRDDDESMITDVNRMTGAAYAICSDLAELHGVKSVAQSRDDYSLTVVAHDDYALLSNVQTVCAWHQSGFTIKSAGRVDGDIVVRFHIDS